GRGGGGPAAEILLRMRDESGNAIAPAHFLASAERYQLMSHIDRWVVQASLTALAGGAPHLPVGRTCNLNLSAQTLADDHFLDFQIVAEQVEDQESFETLRSLGVDFVQGFVVERPRPLHAVH